MLKKFLSFSIIALVRNILPFAGVFLIVPILLKDEVYFRAIQNFFNANKHLFFLSHLAICLILYFAWPHIIKQMQAKLNVIADAKQIKAAMAIRWYLLLIILFFDLLNFWR